MPYAELYSQSTTVTGDAVTATIAAGPAHTPLIVIDSILGTGQTSGGGGLTIEHSITGGVGTVVFVRSNLAAATPGYIHLDFAGGWPLWILTGTDATPGGATSIIMRAPATLSNACLTVIYHYEKASTRN